MGQDCPSVLLYMMHSNNNNLYVWSINGTGSQEMVYLS